MQPEVYCTESQRQAAASLCNTLYIWWKCVTPLFQYTVIAAIIWHCTLHNANVTGKKKGYNNNLIPITDTVPLLAPCLYRSSHVPSSDIMTKLTLRTLCSVTVPMCHCCLVVICIVLCSVCVNVYCHRVTAQLQLINISISKAINVNTHYSRTDCNKHLKKKGTDTFHAVTVGRHVKIMNDQPRLQIPFTIWKTNKNHCHVRLYETLPQRNTSDGSSSHGKLFK
jgi:hypothetical protein